jgi:NAD(P)H dehydrogenase (quinone)
MGTFWSGEAGSHSTAVRTPAEPVIWNYTAVQSTARSRWGVSTMGVRLAVIFYSATGSVHALAEAVAEGGREIGAEVRLRRVPELAGEDAIDSNPAWRTYVDATKLTVTEASLHDLEWANAYAFGSPTRFGLPAAQLKQFLDRTGSQWQAGVFHQRPVTSFTSAGNSHGGQESTILALNNVFYHWGCVIVAPGYTDQVLYGAGGNPYGTSWTGNDGAPSEQVLKAARYQGRLLTSIAARLAGAGQQPSAGAA